MLVAYATVFNSYTVGDLLARAGVVRAEAVARVEVAAMAMAEVVGAVTVAVWPWWWWWCAFLVSVLASALSRPQCRECSEVVSAAAVLTAVAVVRPARPQVATLSSSDANSLHTNSTYRLW